MTAAARAAAAASGRWWLCGPGGLPAPSACAAATHCPALVSANTQRDFASTLASVPIHDCSPQVEKSHLEGAKPLRPSPPSDEFIDACILLLYAWGEVYKGCKPGACNCPNRIGAVFCQSGPHHSPHKPHKTVEDAHGIQGSRLVTDQQCPGMHHLQFDDTFCRSCGA